MWTRKLLAPMGALVALAMLANCAPASTPTPTAKAANPTAAPTLAPTSAPKPNATIAPAATPKPAADQPRSGGILTIGAGGDPPSLDVHREETGYNFAITAAAYNGLVKADPHAWPELKIIPELATSWDIAPDGKTYTFHLVKGAKFHDGSLFTSEDAKYSLDRIRDPKLGLTKSPRRQQLSNVSSIETPDDSTVKINLSDPKASFLPMLSTVYFSIMPKKVVEAKKGDMTNTIVGTGAFKFKSYSSGVGWELTKNPEYFIKGRPYLDGVKGYIIADPFTRFAALRTRSILWWSPFPYMSVPQAKEIEDSLSDKIELKWGFHPAWYGVVFNVTRPPWNDVRLRQAVSLTFDRKKMLAIGLQGAGVLGMSPQPPGEFALSEEEMKKMPGYDKPDIDAAKKLMGDAGYPNGFKTDALVWQTAMHQAMAVLFRDAMTALGISVDLNVQETTSYYDQRFRKTFATLAGGSGNASLDPDITLGDYYVTDSSRNWAGYSNPELDQLFAKQSRTIDPTERRKIVGDMQRILLKDVPIAIAYWSKVAYAWWKEVRGFTPPNTFFDAYGYQEIWLAK